jgi:hypothetical protein
MVGGVTGGKVVRRSGAVDKASCGGQWGLEG